MASLALRNLFQDKVRLAITLTGVVFAVVLVAIQAGLFLGFRKATSDIIDHSQADLWIGAKNVPYIEGGMVFSERKLYQALATPGVASAEKYIVQFMWLEDSRRRTRRGANHRFQSRHGHGRSVEYR